MVTAATMRESSKRAVPQVRKALGERVRDLRHRANLSQVDLGKKAGLSAKFLGEMERGAKSISLDSLWHIAKVLKVPLADLLALKIGKAPANGAEG